MLDNIGATSTFCKMSSPRTVPENLCSSTAFCGLKSALKFNTYSELCSMFSIQLSKEPAKFKLRSDHFSFRTLHRTNATLISIIHSIIPLIFIPIIPLIFTPFLPSDSMTECQKMLHEHIKYSRTGYRVECTDEGLFAPRQCDSGVEKCWCAERSTGRMIFGTYHASHMVGPYNCKKCEYWLKLILKQGPNFKYSSTAS